MMECDPGEHTPIDIEVYTCDELTTTLSATCADCGADLTLVVAHESWGDELEDEDVEDDDADLDI